MPEPLSGGGRRASRKTYSPPGIAVHLAECYWRLGNKQMAVDFLRKMDPFPYDGIKLWADMGETQQALKIAENACRNGSSPILPTSMPPMPAVLRVDTRKRSATTRRCSTSPSKDKGQIDRCHERATGASRRSSSSTLPT